MIHLVLGGARSGKSAYAEALLVGRWRPGDPIVAYLATGTAGPGDADMAARDGRHRARRGEPGVTHEAGAGLIAALGGLPPDAPALVDSLGTWIAAHPDLTVDVDGLVEVLTARPGRTVVVSEEVGLGVHPETEVGRRFRDVLGDVNQAVAAAATEVTLVVAGCPVTVRAGTSGERA